MSLRTSARGTPYSRDHASGSTSTVNVTRTFTASLPLLRTGVPPSYSRAGDLSSTTTVLLSVTSHGHREVWPVLQPCIQRLLVREQGRTAVVLPCDRVLALIVDYHRRAPLVQ